MAKKLRRAFTIVELVIVIAVIAILAAVLIPTFTSLIQKANVSNDTQIVREMNTALSMGEADGRPEDMGDVLNVLSEYGGFDMAKLNPSTDGYLYVWEKTSNQILLMDDKGAVAFSVKDYDQSNWELYVPVANSETAEKVCAYATAVGVYVAENLTYNFELKNVVPFQVADGKTLTGNVTMVGTNAITTSVSGNIVGTLTINNANAEVSHEGTVNAVVLTAVKASSYHEYGTVKESFEVSSGRVVIEESANIPQIAVPSDAENVKIMSNSLQNILVTTESSDVTLENGSGKLFLSGSAADAVADKNQSSESMVTKTVVNNAAELKAAFAKENAYIQLGADILLATTDFDETVGASGSYLYNSINTSSIYLDLNGHFIKDPNYDTFGYTDENNKGQQLIGTVGSITIDDTSSDLSGAIYATRNLIRAEGNSETQTFAQIKQGTFVTKSYTGGTCLFLSTTTVIIDNCNVYSTNFGVYIGSNGNTEKVIINGGKVVGTANNGTKVKNQFAYAFVIGYCPDGIINNLTVYGIQGALSLNGGSVTVNDGYYEASGVAYDLYKEATGFDAKAEYFGDGAIQDGNVFYGGYFAGENEETNIIVNGGTFVSSGRNAILVGNSADGGKGETARVVIYGGTYTGKGSAVQFTSNTSYGLGIVAIYGGTYSHNVEDKMSDLEHYECVQEGDVFVVKAK